jgi:hypothetical protein
LPKFLTKFIDDPFEAIAIVSSFFSKIKIYNFGTPTKSPETAPKQKLSLAIT